MKASWAAGMLFYIDYACPVTDNCEIVLATGSLLIKACYMPDQGMASDGRMIL